MMQQEKGDCLTGGYESELWDFTRIIASLLEESIWYLLWRSTLALLRCRKIQVDKAYSRATNVPPFNLRDLILAHPDTKKRVDVFALSIYGLVIFPKALGHVDEAVSNLFNQLDKRVMPVPAILIETFRSLNACRRAGEGRFIGCVQLFLSWFHSHFWKVEKVSHRVFFENYSPLKELVATPKRDDLSEEKWIAIL
ncbi:hypothetical protein CXB51_009887 [Gossypium anomalum]|uniref:DUF7745 domain-containing protein n=1 Tax=Gossypium anomalum TaxID=47600 RepID=A0A8J5YT27_9ROSI|nr:hypothetical protein CXB51_009887 [Gossypium anomalum]